MQITIGISKTAKDRINKIIVNITFLIVGFIKFLKFIFSFYFTITVPFMYGWGLQ